MQAAETRATIVVCAMVSGTPAGRRSEWPRLDRSRVPVTWIASWDTLSDWAAAVRMPGAVALDIPAAAIEARHRIRTLLARGREAVPQLDTVAVHGPIDRSHRDLLLDEGVRAVVVDRLGDDGRGSRRPAPKGWRCRNTAWGLWEVEAARAESGGWLAWLGGGLPRPRASSLHTVATEGLTTSSGGRLQVHPQLERRLAWAERHLDRGLATAETVRGLVARLAGEERQPLAGSVLRAA